MKTVELDVCGLVCPVPIMEAEKIYANLAKSDKLVITTDHDIVGYNLMDWAEGKEMNAEMQEVEADLWEIVITK